MFGKATIYFWQYVLIVILFSGMGVGIGFGTWHDSNPSIAPTYALDKNSKYDFPYFDKAGDKYFGDFWQEATKDTQFTIDGKPIEITDVQVFYKETTNNIQWYHHTTIEDWLSFIKNHPNITWDSNAWTGLDGNWIAYTEPTVTYGNITYYPQGIEYSKTYVAPTPIICPTPSSSCPSRSCYDIITAPPCYIAPTPTPTPCAWQSERTAYSFCGKVIVNSSAEFDLLLKDIEKHSYHIQMGWMHLDYEYAHKTYDNTLPAPVNICMGIIPGDDFPIGSEWEGRMTYVIDECAPLGSCDFDTLILIPTPTPTPILAFPYEFCANGCVICTDHLGNCTYIPGRPTPTSTP